MQLILNLLLIYLKLVWTLDNLVKACLISLVNACSE